MKKKLIDFTLRELYFEHKKIDEEVKLINANLKKEWDKLDAQIEKFKKQKESLLLKIKNKRAEKTLSIRQSENKIKKDLLKEHNLKMETITTNLEAKINKRQKRIENLVTENYELQKRIYNLTEENSKYLEQIIK